MAEVTPGGKDSPWVLVLVLVLGTLIENSPGKPCESRFPPVISPEK